MQIEEAVKAYIYVYFELVDGAACRILCVVCAQRVCGNHINEPNKLNGDILRSNGIT